MFRDKLAFLVLAFSFVLAATESTFAQTSTTDEDLADRGVQFVEARDAAVKRAIDRAANSTVAVLLRERDRFDRTQGRADIFARTNIDREEDDLTAAAVGSGIILDNSGKILTCHHLIRLAYTDSGRYELVVRTADSRRFIVSRENILAGDPRSDLAVIQILGAAPNSLKPIVRGDGGKLFRGQTVIALGNAFGVANLDGRPSASLGVISNLARRAEPVFPGLLDTDDRQRERIQHLYTAGDLVQVDCRLNLDVSGGPLIDIRGRMIGVIVALAARNGLESPGGFAVPLDDLNRRVIETLQAGKEVEYGFLGINLDTYSRFDAGEDGPQVDGVRVQGVVLSDLNRSGLAPNDVITAINGQPVKTKGDLILTVGAFPVGSVIRIKVVRGSRTLEISVPLAKFPVRGDKIATNRRPTWNGIRVDHASVLLENPQVHLPPFGVAIESVESGSPADLAGIPAPSLMTSINDQPVKSPEQFEKLVRAAKDSVKVRIGSPSQDRFGSDWNFVDITLPAAQLKSAAQK